MANGHAHQWVQVSLVLQETLPVSEHVTQAIFSLRWGVDDLASAVIGQLGTRHPAYIHVHALKRATNFDCCASGEWALGQRPVAMIQSLAVAQGFVSRRVCMVVAILGMLEEQIRGGDDTFDLRAVLGFQQWDGIDQHLLVRDQLRRLF